MSINVLFVQNEAISLNIVYNIIPSTSYVVDFDARVMNLDDAMIGEVHATTIHYVV